MKPAFSVLFLTTLIGAGQGLFLALYGAELAGAAGLVPRAPVALLGGGGLVALVLTGFGLVASIFHLGRPGRGWRAASRWRTSWLSREVIVLPLFMAGTFAWSLAQFAGGGTGGGFVLGGLTAALALLLYLCTGMIYASLRTLQEWATPLTPVNYLLLGLASGAVLAAAIAAATGSPLAATFGAAGLVFTLAGAATRIASLVRNRALRPRSNLQTAIGIAHPRIAQRAQGFMGGSFNTREFFHGAGATRFLQVKWTFLLLAFAVPIVLLAAGGTSAAVLGLAFAVQYLGLLAERWYFFAEANHPQNLYYQAIS